MFKNKVIINTCKNITWIKLYIAIKQTNIRKYMFMILIYDCIFNTEKGNFDVK